MKRPQHEYINFKHKDENKKQNNDKGNSLSMKWVYLIIVALVVGFGVYGYFKVKQWVHYTVIENTEKPITGYTITKISADEHRPYRHRGYNDDNEKERLLHGGVVSRERLQTANRLFNFRKLSKCET